MLARTAAGGLRLARCAALVQIGDFSQRVAVPVLQQPYAGTGLRSRKRALLSQGYQIDDAKPLNIRGDKYFRPSAEQGSTLSITLVCLPSSLGTVIYANALETQYEMKSKGSNAGVSVSALGSVTLPWAADKDTLVKIGEETVTDPAFYQRLFQLIKDLDGG